MTLELPDIPVTEGLSQEELKLELACALYARGKIGKLGGATLAGVDFFEFQGALTERGIPLYTVEMVDEDQHSLHELRKR
jgi:predicted HTH domain antitoxin